MSNPIILWQRKATTASDEAGTAITSYALPRTVPGPYEAQEKARAQAPLTYIPSLKAICLRKLLDFPDQVHTLGSFRLPYQAPTSTEERDIIRELIPFYGQDEDLNNTDFLNLVDPRLWAVLVQTYSGVPDDFRIYNLPLSDMHMPVLQQIPQTPRFSLVTVLELCGCKELNDDSIVELRVLHSIGALDVSLTAVSSFGISRLSKTLVRSIDADHGEGGRIGPWMLRIVYLKDCMNIDNEVYRSLEAFPLLSVVDLRGTQCTLNNRSPFHPIKNSKLFRPTPLLDTLTALSQLSIPHNVDAPTLWSNPEPFYLHVTALNHKPTHRIPSTVKLMNDFRHRTTHDGSKFFSENAETRVWTLPSILSLSSTQRHSGPALPRLEDLALDSNVLNMQAVAAAESRRMGATASALAFYSTAPRNSKPLPPWPSRTGKEARTAFQFAFGRAASEALTLYRKPPPWSIMDNVSGIERAVPRTANQDKRLRVEIDEALMTANDAKRQGNATQAVQAIWSMAERRKSTRSDKPSVRKKAMPILGNPFLRKMAKSDFEDVDEVEAAESPPAARSYSNSRDKKQEGSDFNPLVDSQNDDVVSDAVQKSTLPVPPPTTRPLRPISSLSIPIRPIDASTAKPSPQYKSSTAKSSRSLDQRTTQMKLSAFAGDTAKKEQARGLPRSSRSSVDTKSADSRVVSKDIPQKEAGSAVHRKRKGPGSSSFDWRNWSTG